VIILSTTESLAFIMLIGIALMSILFGIAFSDEVQPKTSINIVSNRNENACYYEAASRGAEKCPETSSMTGGIFSESVCKRAGQSVRFSESYSSTPVKENNANHPKGCFVYQGVYQSGVSYIDLMFNEHSDGSADSNSTPLCVITGSEVCKTANVGSSSNVAKTIDFDPKFRCPTIVNKNNWNNDEKHYGDIFKVEQTEFSGTQTEGTLTVTRIDEQRLNDNWGMELKFKCCTCY